MRVIELAASSDEGALVSLTSGLSRCVFTAPTGMIT